MRQHALQVHGPQHVQPLAQAVLREPRARRVRADGALHGLDRQGAYIGYNLHELRHTQATLLIGSGADIKTVQQRLGHSSASLTMDIYAHFIAQNDRVAANTIGEILAEAAEKPEELAQPALSDADRAAIARYMADGASLEAAISAVRPDVSVLDLLGI